MLRLVVEERIMPPWYANAASGPWQNDARLADWERELVLAWIEHGAPAGEAADGPARIAWPSGWLIGEPDIVLYPDSGKVGVAERGPGGQGLLSFHRLQDNVDYHEGEEFTPAS